MRKWIIALVVSFILLAGLISASASDDISEEINVIIDDSPLYLENPPVIQEGRALIPMRAFFETLGAEVKWDPETRTAIGMQGDIVVQLPIGSIYPAVNWERAVIDVPAQIIDDRTYIPLRFVGQALGDEVSWDGDTRTITVARGDGIPNFDAVQEDPETGPFPELPPPDWPESGHTSAPYPPGNSIFIFPPKMHEWLEAWSIGDKPEELRQTRATHILSLGGLARGREQEEWWFSTYEEMISDFGLKMVLWLPTFSIIEPEALDPRDRDKLEGEYCVDIDGNPMGWYPAGDLQPWQCMHSPAWREYRLEAAKRTIDWGGADDIAVDEWLGDFGAIPFNGCFNEYSMEGFREYLKQKHTAQELQDYFSIDNIETFDYGNLIREGHLSTYKKHGWKEHYQDESWNIPLWRDFRDYHMKFAVKVQAELIAELRDYAQAQGKKIHFAANTFQLVPDALPIQSELDYLAAEIVFEFPAEGRMIPYYKVGTSMGTPLFPHPQSAAEETEELMFRQDLAQLWKIYIAEAYSSQGFMGVPSNFPFYSRDESIAITADLEELSPYCSFIRDNGQFFNDLHSTSRIAVLFSYSSSQWAVDSFQQSFYGTNNLLLDTHFQYDVVFAGDDNWIVDELSLEELNRYQVVILPDTRNLTDNQVDLLLSYLESGGRIAAFGDIGTHNEKNKRVDSDREELQGLLVEGMHKYGGGWFSYMDGNPGSDYYNERTDPTREEFAKALRKLIHPNILTDADENVAMQKYWNSDAGANIIHLINYNYDLDKQHIHTQRGIELEVMLNEQLQEKELEVYCASPDQTEIQKLDHIVRAGRVEFQVPELEYYSVVFIGEEGSFKSNE